MICNICRLTLYETLPRPVKAEMPMPDVLSILQTLGGPEKSFPRWASRDPDLFNSRWVLRLHHRSADSFWASVHDGCYICKSAYDSSSLNGMDLASLRPFAREVVFSSLGIELDAERPQVRFIYPRDAADGPLYFTLDFHEPPRMPISLNHGEVPNGVPDKLALSKFWFDRCSREHNCAESRNDQYIPSRLLKISDEKWRLVCASEYPLPARLEYGTVSHRWTAETFRLMLKTRNLTTLKSEHSLTKLPNDFRKAVSIARYLAIEFLWIDSLCIIQDSKDMEDWARESMLMQDIYRNSVCNIVIQPIEEPDSDSSTLDRFNRAQIKEVEWVNLKWKRGWFRKKIRHSYTVERNDFWESSTHRTELSARGWIFQELMLSPRILHVYDDQLFWECPQMSACEWHPSGDLSFQGSRTKRDLNQLIEGFPWRNYARDDSRWYEAWGDVVQFYSACDLTDRKDKLVAFAGVAKTLAGLMRTQEGYFAGMFRRSLPHGLLWHRNSGQSSFVRSPEYREPSWSWASVDGGVTFEDASLKREGGNRHPGGSAWDTPGRNGTLLATLKEISTVPLTNKSDPYGEVIGGHIVLSGPLVLAQFPQRESSAEIEGYGSLPRVDVLDEAALFDETSDHTGQERICLPIVLKQTVFLVGTVSGLILSPCACEDNTLSFTRIGVFRCKTASVTLAGNQRIYRPLQGTSISYMAEESFRGELAAWRSLQKYSITIY